MKNIMKKYFISFLLTLSCFLFINSNFAKSTELDFYDQNTFLELQKRVVELENLMKQSKINVDSESHSLEYLEGSIKYPKLVLNKFAELFKFVLDKCDKMTSKKFVIAFCMAVGPLIALYCSIFDSQPLLNLINSFFSYSTKSATDTGAALGKGMIEGVVDGAMDNKLAVAEFAGAGISLYTVWIFFSQIVLKVAGAAGDRIAHNINPQIK